MKKGILIGIAIMVLVTVFAIIIQSEKAEANPSSFPGITQTAPATTTLSFLTAGTATTSLVYDSYGVGQPTRADEAMLLVWLNATNTSTTLDITLQYSQGSGDGSNCVTTPTKCDWFYSATAGDFATTTLVANISTVGSYRWTFASTSPVLGISTGVASTTRAIYVKTPTRYVRAVFTLPTGSSNAGVWAQFVPTKQN